MKPLLRATGMAVLAAALLNVSAGLCFCHRGPAAPGAEAASESTNCCHGPQAPSGTSLNTPAPCCQIESAESSAVTVGPVHVAPPAAPFTLIALPAAAQVARPAIPAAVSSTSPPVLALRI